MHSPGASSAESSLALTPISSPEPNSVMSANDSLSTTSLVPPPLPPSTITTRLSCELDSDPSVVHLLTDLVHHETTKNATTIGTANKPANRKKSLVKSHKSQTDRQLSANRRSRIAAASQEPNLSSSPHSGITSALTSSSSPTPSSNSSPNSSQTSTAYISSAATSATTIAAAQATPHGINDILRKNAAAAAAAAAIGSIVSAPTAPTTPTSTIQSSVSADSLSCSSPGSPVSDGPPPVSLASFGHLAAAAAAGLTSSTLQNSLAASGLSSALSNVMPNCSISNVPSAFGSNLAGNLALAAAAAAANSFYQNSAAVAAAAAANSGSLNPLSQLSSATSAPTSTNGTITAVNSPRIDNKTFMQNSSMTNSMKLSLDQFNSRQQIYLQQMVQNEAMWRERLNAVVSGATSGPGSTDSGAAHSIGLSPSRKF